MTTSTEKAYRFLRQSILDGRFPPGTRLREQAIAKSADISRTPVREALRRLSAEGLVDFEPNSGAKVAALSAEAAEETMNVRVLLEGYATELAARKITPSALSELRDMQAVMDAAVERNGTPDYDTVTEQNTAFHSLIIDIAANTRLRAAHQQVLQPTLILRTVASYTRERLLHSYSGHHEILSALEVGDADWAGSAMRTHLLSARKHATELAKAQVERIASSPGPILGT